MEILDKIAMFFGYFILGWYSAKIIGSIFRNIINRS